MGACPAIDALLARWRQERVELNPPASDAALAALERNLGAPLPESLRAFFRSANGMPNLEMDSGGASFWSVEKIIEEHEVERGSDARGEWTDWAIADVLINSHFISLRLRPHHPPALAVEGFGLEFATFAELAAAYLEDSTRFGA